MSHRDIVDSEHPIICLPMNRVSDITLAIAVSKTGCFPSLVMSSYSHSWGKIFYYDKFRSDMVLMMKETGSCRVMLSMTDFFLITHFEQISNLVEVFGIRHIEIVPYYGGSKENSFKLETYIEYLLKLKNKGVKIFVKCLFVPAEEVAQKMIKHGIIDAIVVKSNKGAGMVHYSTPNIFKLISKAKFLYPNIHIIASGGIATSSDIQLALDCGASAVGLGTLFAMSKECKINIESKARALASKNIIHIVTNGLPQNGIVFQETEEWDNDNNSRGLELGVNGEGGHLFIGQGIEQVSEILSVEDIVKKLIPEDGFRYNLDNPEPTPQ